MLFREGSGQRARERIFGVVREDRTHLTARDMAMIRLDVLAALSEYVEMDRENVQVQMIHGQNGTENALSLHVPILCVRTGKRNNGK